MQRIFVDLLVKQISLFDWEVFVLEEKNKRRKYRDNPYTLIIDNNKFYIEFDSNLVEVSKEIFIDKNSINYDSTAEKR